MRLLSAIFAMVGATVVANAAKQPNVIIINIDNHSKSMLGCYGNKLIETPNIDKLHSDGFSFDNYQCASRCSASRSALLSGKYHQRFGSIGTGDARLIMKAGVTTMVDYFNESGYRTAMFGKWHNGYNYPHRPEDRGFHEVVEKGKAKDRGESGKLSTVNKYRHNGTMETFEGYRTDVWFNEMNKFIQKNQEQPFFIYVATWATHGPNFGPKELLKKYQAKSKQMGITLPKLKDGDGLDENILNIAAEVERIDMNLGKTKSVLKELGLDENTIVIYMADGPGDKAEKDINPDGIDGSHIPLILNWPGGNLSKGEQSTELVANLDVLPTLIEMCDLKGPENTFDGQSFAGIMNQQYTPWSPRIYVSDHQSARKSREWGMVSKSRTTMYTPKGEFSWGKGKLNKSPSPELEQYGEAEYTKWWESVLKDFPDYNHIVVGTKYENPSLIDTSYTLKDKFAGKGEKYYFAIEFAEAGTYEISENSKNGKGGAKLGLVIVDGKEHEGALPMSIEMTPGKHLVFVDSGKGKGKGSSSIKIEKL